MTQLTNTQQLRIIQAAIAAGLRVTKAQLPDGRWAVHIGGPR